jgi:hypothetical protein
MQVLDGRAHDVDLGREVVQHRAARQAGLVRDDRGGGAGVTEVDDAAKRGLDDLQARRRALLCLPAGGHGWGTVVGGIRIASFHAVQSWNRPACKHVGRVWKSQR